MLILLTWLILQPALPAASAPPAPGPWHLAQPPTEPVRALATDPARHVLYAGTQSGALLRTFDGGATWSAVDGVDVGEIRQLVVDPARPGIMWAAGESGLAKSVDGGGSWEPLSFGPNVSLWKINALQQDRAGTDILFAATSDGFFDSRDGGASWLYANAGMLPYRNVAALAADPFQPGKLYAAVDRSVLVSADGGASWQPTGGAAVASSGNDIRTLAIDPVSPGRLYATTATELFRTTDGGATWQEADAGLPRHFYGDALAIDPAHPATIFAGAVDGIYRSDDGGDRWRLDAALGQVDVLLFAGPSGTLYAGNLDGLYVTDAHASGGAGSSWRHLSGQPLGMSVAGGDPWHAGTFYASGFRGLFVSTDGGACWSRIHDGLPSGLPAPNMMVEAIVADPLRAGVLYVADVVDGLYRSTDGGSSWSKLEAGLNHRPVLRLAAAPSAAGRLYAASSMGGLYASSDGGDHWRWAGESLPLVDVGVLAVDPTDANTLYAGTSGEGLFKSADGGASWRRLGGGLPADPVNVVALAVDPRQAATLYLALNSNDGPLGIFKSTDGGRRWAATGKGLPRAAAMRAKPGKTPWNSRGGDRWAVWGDKPVGFSALIIDPRDGAHLYAGTLSHGVFETRDGGAHWRAASSGVTDPEILGLVLDRQAPSRLLAVTPSGLFASRNGGATWVPANTGLVDAYPRRPEAGVSGGCPRH
jgi:photosystem II stability/assembly factor-like uncharacterized protein